MMLARTLVRGQKLRSVGWLAASCGLACGMTMNAASTFAQVRESESVIATSEDFAFARKLSRVFKSVATKVEPGVVHVTQSRMVQRTDWFGRPIGAAMLQQTGLGSGAIIDAAGIVITNNHVIDRGESFKVRLSNGDELEATLIGRDPQTDLAVLQIKDPPSDLPTLSFADSDALEVGEWVVAVGSPFGLDSSVTQGIVSARGRSVTPRETGRSYEDYIQTDAAINPGNSGGPLLNLEGKIVGINTAIASRTGGYDGIGFAIPSNTARLVVENIRKHGRVLRGWLGVGLENSEEINGQSRVLVGSVQMGSPAAAAGLREGDVITRFQGVAMDEARMRNAIATLPAGSVVNIEVERGGAPVKLTAMLADRSANNTTFIEALGVEVVPVDERLSEELGFQGVMIWDTTADGRAANRFQKNDVIVAVDGDPVKNERDFAKAIEAADFQRGVRFNVLRPVQVRQGNRVETTFDRGRIDIRD